MLSFNELSTSIQGLQLDHIKGKIQGIQQDYLIGSKNQQQKSLISQLNSSHSSSRKLFHKCKSIIHEQMIQIRFMTQENNQLSQAVKSSQQQTNQLRSQITHLQSQITQLKNLNQTLHKQINAMNFQTQALHLKAQQNQNLIKLSSNKNQALQSMVQKLQHQNSAYNQKCNLMQQTIELISLQNQKFNQLIMTKDNQMQLEIQKLKQFKLLLERKNQVQRFDLPLTQKMSLTEAKQEKNCKNSNTAVFDDNPFKTVSVNRYAKPNNIRTHKDQNKIYEVNSHDRNNQKPATNNKSLHIVNAFTILDQKPSVSRIRKNISKPKQRLQDQQAKTNHKFNQISVPSSKDSKKIEHKIKAINPQIQSQLSGIKKQILRQYGMIEVKKQFMNQGIINKTLKDIEEKLQKMTKLTALDPSQSQFD